MGPRLLLNGPHDLSGREHVDYEDASRAMGVYFYPLQGCRKAYVGSGKGFTTPGGIRNTLKLRTCLTEKSKKYVIPTKR